MRAQRIKSDSGEAVYLLVFEAGDEVMSAIHAFAVQEKLQVCRLSGIGAFNNLTLGFFDVPTREYRKIAITEQVELLALVGNISEADGQPRVHVHVVVGKSDGTTLGGHLLEGRVQPTLELFLTAWPTRIARRINPQSGLMLIDLSHDTKDQA